MMKLFGFRNVLFWTAATVGFFTLAPGFFRSSTPVWIMFGILAVGGFVRATQFTASNALAFAELDQSQVTAASTLQAVILQLSISMGITLGSLALQLVRISSGGQALTPSQFTVPFCFLGALALLATPIYARLTKIGADDFPSDRSRRERSAPPVAGHVGANLGQARSVRLKSSPLNSKDEPVTLARA